MPGHDRFILMLLLFRSDERLLIYVELFLVYKGVSLLTRAGF